MYAKQVAPLAATEHRESSGTDLTSQIVWGQFPNDLRSLSCVKHMSICQGIDLNEHTILRALATDFATLALIFYFLTQRYFVKGLTAGAIKGL
jgi:hypothetical protein